MQKRQTGTVRIVVVADLGTCAPITAINPSCPLCHVGDVRLLRSVEQIELELVPARARGDKLMHSNAANIFGCDRCDTLFRDPAGMPDDVEARYRDDRYGRAELDRLRRAGIAECRRKTRWLTAQGLSQSATLLEIGSYVGSFLSFAEGLGCHAVGVDIGREVSAFARGYGVDVYTEPFTAERFGARRFDSVWILNCFEQVPDTLQLLRDVATVLKPEGRLVMRTPSADFVRAAWRSQHPLVRLTADANGLLGMPFSKCFSTTRLLELLRDEHFGDFRVRGHDFAATAPPGYPFWWRHARHLRTVTYRFASLRSGLFLYPWVDISAARGSRSQ